MHGTTRVAYRRSSALLCGRMYITLKERASKPEDGCFATTHRILFHGIRVRICTAEPLGIERWAVERQLEYPPF